MARTVTFTWKEYREFWHAWADQYLAGPSAWSIDGRPVCAFNNLGDFVSRYGRATFAIMLQYGARLAECRVGVRPYLLGVIGAPSRHNVELANALPIDGVTGYGLLPNWMGRPVQDYATLVRQRVSDWEQMQRRLRLPFYPVVCTGWDATMRGAFSGQLRSEDGYPNSPVVVGVTPALFGEFIDHAIAFNRRWQPRESIVFLHAWNEWTESSVLEPSDRFGDALLKEVRRRSCLLTLSPPPADMLSSQFAP